MYFDIKSTLKSNRNHTPKQTQKYILKNKIILVIEMKVLVKYGSCFANNYWI
jgi:hypothetical protein